MTVQARIVGASRGARWLGEGWQLFRLAPLAWLALSCVYLLGTNVLALIPVVGPDTTEFFLVNSAMMVCVSIRF